MHHSRGVDYRRSDRRDCVLPRLWNVDDSPSERACCLRPADSRDRVGQTRRVSGPAEKMKPGRFPRIHRMRPFRQNRCLKRSCARHFLADDSCKAVPFPPAVFPGFAPAFGIGVRATTETNFNRRRSGMDTHVARIPHSLVADEARKRYVFIRGCEGQGVQAYACRRRFRKGRLVLVRPDPGDCFT